MKNLISLALLLFSISANAQYHATAVEGRRWNQYLHQIVVFFPSMHYQEFRGDTLYKGKIMKKLITVNGNGGFKSLDALVYEDSSAASMTYYYPTKSLFGDSVFMDFNLNVGDSSIFICGGDTGYYRLESTSTFTDLNNILRKEHHLSMLIPSASFGSSRFYFDWIEGFGNMGGTQEYPLPAICFSDPADFEVTCIFDSSSSQLYQNPNFNACDHIGIEEIDYPKISLYPNPASTFIEIETDNLSDIQSIQIVNSRGGIVATIWNPEKKRIDIQHFPAGLYSLNALFENGIIPFEIKFIKTQ